MTTWIIPTLALLSTLAGGGLFGAWLAHRRLAPVSAADVTDRDWARFQGEIKRLDDKVKAHETRITELEEEVESCHREKREMEERWIRERSDLTERVTRLQTIVDQEGQFRQMAQNMVSAERNEGLDRPFPKVVK